MLMIKTANYQVDILIAYFDLFDIELEFMQFTWWYCMAMPSWYCELSSDKSLIQIVACLVKKNMNIKKEKVVTMTNINCIDDTIMMNWYCHERDWLKFIGGLVGGRLWRINHHKIRSTKQAREKKGEQKKNIDLLTTLFP